MAAREDQMSLSGEALIEGFALLIYRQAGCFGSAQADPEVTACHFRARTPHRAAATNRAHENPTSLAGPQESVVPRSFMLALE